MAAFVAAILAQLADRTPWLAAILADRYRPAPVIAACVPALAAVYAIGVVGGALLATRMTPEAKQLLLAMALVLAGGSAAFAAKAPDRLEGWRLGGFGTTLAGIFVLALGDRTQFVAFALAARTPVPALAAIGATLGSLAVVVPAALIGERRWRRLPLAGLRWTSGALLLACGLVLGLDAVALI